MRIDLHKITIREVVNEYKDSAEEGVIAYGGKLDIRPKYQREFVYSGKQREAVIKTVLNGFPLNVMYWMVKTDGEYEVLDGQQRTISIAQYVNSNFYINDGKHEKYFHNLTDDEQNRILDYDLMIYFCEGTDKERLDWFRIVNIAGEKLTEQELRNAVYTGPWLSDAKLKFSKTNCAAYLLANDSGQLMTGTPIRQDYLEQVLTWISDDRIENYMAVHQLDENADELWQYFQEVIAWVRRIFPNHRNEMSKVDWGRLFNKYGTLKPSATQLESEVAQLMMDDEVQKKSGIYEYVLGKDERCLNLRAFTPKQKREVYERQNGICVICKKHFELIQMEADHITPRSLGGKTIEENCQLLCKDDNRRKSDK